MGEGLTKEQCCRKWKLLRDKFIRELKKILLKSRDSGPLAVLLEPLFGIMSFLSDTVKNNFLLYQCGM